MLAPLLASPEIAKHVHDAKTLEVLLLRRGLTAARASRRTRCWRRTCWTRRARATTWTSSAAAEGIPAVASRASWMGTGATANAGRRHLGRGGRRAARARRRRRRWRWRRPQAGQAGDGRASIRSTATWSCRSRTCSRTSSAAASSSTPTGCARSALEVGTQLAALETEIHALAGMPFNINSPKQLADVLFGKLSLPVVRKTKTGPSTDADTLEELAALHPVPAKIVDYRVLSKLKGTYIDALPALVNPATGRLHTSFNQAVAATGRLSSSNPNLQNIPIRTEVGRRIRQAFVAKPGPRAGLGGLLADRAPDPRALLAGSGVPGRVPLGPGHPPAHGGRGVRRAVRVGDRRAPARRQGDQLRAVVRAERLRPRAGAAHPARAGEELHPELLRTLRGRARLHGAHASPRRAPAPRS